MPAPAPAPDRESLSDTDLVARIRNGDHMAFATIMRRHNQRLFRVARSITRDDAEAEDVVQESYVRAFASLSGFRGAAKLSTWLTRIALNEALDRVRSRRPQVELHLVDDGADAAAGAGAADPEKDAARAEIRRLVEDAVDALPDIFRVVFVLRDVEELSIEETAAFLDLKPETVKTRLHRARRMLRARLEDALAAALTEAFPFAGARCSGIVAAVLARLGIAG